MEDGDEDEETEQSAIVIFLALPTFDSWPLGNQPSASDLPDPCGEVLLLCVSLTIANCRRHV